MSQGQSEVEERENGEVPEASSWYSARHAQQGPQLHVQVVTARTS